MVVSRRDRHWFIAERDTATDEIVRMYPASEVFAERVSFAALAAAEVSAERARTYVAACAA